MSDAPPLVVPCDGLTATDVNSDPPCAQEGAGTLLKQAREASGLHIGALAVLLKVPVKKLEALESDRLDLLPDAVFVRALASSVCRTLKIDATAILARLPQNGAPKLTYQGTSINEPFRSPSYSPNPSVWPSVSKPALLAGMLLTLGAMVLIFLPGIKAGLSSITVQVSDDKPTALEAEKPTQGKAVADSGSPDSETVKVASVNLLTTARTEVVPSGQVPSAASTLYVSGAPEAGKGVVNAPLSDTPAQTLTKTSSADTLSPTLKVTSNAPLASDVVVFTAKTESWVEATDAKGRVVLRRILVAGEVVGTNGLLPLKVTVGRADATQVQIRGKAFDINALAKDNVARFEVK